jgi:hypothetical protein
MNIQTARYSITLHHIHLTTLFNEYQLPRTQYSYRQTVPIMVSYNRRSIDSLHGKHRCILCRASTRLTGIKHANLRRCWDSYEHRAHTSGLSQLTLHVVQSSFVPMTKLWLTKQHTCIPCKSWCRMILGQTQEDCLSPKETINMFL